MLKGENIRRAESLEETLRSKRLRAGGEGGNRGWDGWMASPTQWTWVWANSGRWWWTGKPGVLQSMASPKVGHDLATEQQRQSKIKRDSWMSHPFFPRNQSQEGFFPHLGATENNSGMKELATCSQLDFRMARGQWLLCASQIPHFLTGMSENYTYSTTISWCMCSYS